MITNLSSETLLLPPFQHLIADLTNENSTVIYYLIAAAKRGGKSQSIAKILILLFAKGDYNILICRNKRETILSSVWNEILNVIAQLQMGAFFHVNLSSFLITHRRTGGTIAFKNLYEPMVTDDLKFGAHKRVSSINFVITQPHLLVWIDEAFEITDSNLQHLIGSLPSVPDRRFIFSFNPWNESRWVVQEAYRVGQPDLDVLKTDHWTITQKDQFWTLFSTVYTNTFLTAETIAGLEKWAKIEPHRAPTILYGLISTPEESVFYNFREQIHVVLPKNLDRKDFYTFTIGIDLGISGATCAILTAFDARLKKFWFIEEFYHSNGEKNYWNSLTKQTQYASIKEYTQSLANFINSCIQKYVVKGRLLVLVDDNLETLIYALRRLTPANAHVYKTKKPSIFQRCTFLNQKFYQREAFISINCPNLIVQTKNAGWMETTTTTVNPKMIGLKHALDAAAYGFIPFIEQIT